jgi:replicative DNA helicase
MSWETTLIGTALSNPQSMEEAQDLLPSDFTGPNQAIWAEMLALSNLGQFDLRAVCEALRPSWSHETPIEEYLAQVFHDRGTAMEVYAGKVLNDSIKRAVRRAATLIAIQAEEENADANEILDFAEKQVMQLRRTRINEGVTIGDIIAVLMPRIEGMRDGTVQPAWTPALHAVQDVMNFMEASDFMVIGGRPGEGKSSYIRLEAWEMAMKGKPVAIMNMENDPIEYARYCISLDTGLDGRKLKDPRLLSSHELEIVKGSARRLKELPIHIVTLGGPSMAEVGRIARRLVQQHKIELLGIDYIQLMRNGFERRVDDIAITTAGLRAFALNTGVPVMAASQLNRAIETRNNGEDRPVLADLRESGSIEQDATIVTFIRPVWRNPTNDQLARFPENIAHGQVLDRPKAIPVRFHFAKNRNGDTGVSDAVKWIKPNGRFMTINSQVIQ